MQSLHSEVDILETENKTLKVDISNLKNEFNKTPDVENKIHKINDHLDNQDYYSRQNNLRFNGLGEKTHESWEETQEIVQRVLRDKFNFGKTTGASHRVGHPDVLQPATIVAQFRGFC